MKKIILLFSALALMMCCAYAQVPEGVSYQAVARDNAGLILVNQNLDVKFAVRKGSAAGSLSYEETHTTSTNAYGLFTLVIGEGTPNTGAFSGIDWGSGNHFLEVQVDAGQGFVTMGTTKFESVPYSQFADKADMGLQDLTDVAPGAPTDGQVIKWNATTNRWEPANDVGGGVGDNWGSQVVQTDGTFSGNGVSGNSLGLATQGATNGQVLKFNGSAWVPGTDATGGGGGTYTAGSGIGIAGNVISNTAPDQAVNLTGSGATSVTGSYPNFTINSTDNNTTYTAGTGIGISGNVITNNGDFDASDDITTSSTAGGDVSGTFNSLTVNALRGRNVSTTAPSNGQILKWDGNSWAPAADGGGSASVWSTGTGAIYYNAGDVGIGTTTPDGKFEVYANSSLSDPHILLHENGNDYARLRFQNNNSSNYWTIASYIASNNRNDRLNFWNGTSGDLMTLTGDGRLGLNVGISPKTSFHVGNGHRVLFGIDTLGNGDKLMFLPDLHAFRVGTVATGAASTYWNRDSIGLYSFASGYNTRAQGFGATAMGRDTEATNSYAFASGFFSNADGQYSTAMGFNTDAFALGSTALGYSTDAEANYSFAVGHTAEAQAIYSMALGRFVQAQSFASVAVGSYNIGGGSATSWNADDPIFEVGIGNNSSARANALTIQKDGDVGIGTYAPTATLQVIGTTRLGSAEEITDGGSFLMDFDATLRPATNNGRSLGNATKRWNTVYATNGTINTSDRRDKNNIKNLHYGLNEVMKLRPVSFTWKDQPETGTKIGLIAQELQEVISEVVLDKDWETNEETGEKTEIEAERLGVYYSDLIPVLIKSIQEQQGIIDQQSKDIDMLKKEVQALKKK